LDIEEEGIMLVVGMSTTIRRIVCDGHMATPNSWPRWSSDTMVAVSVKDTNKLANIKNTSLCGQP